MKRQDCKYDEAVGQITDLQGINLDQIGQLADWRKGQRGGEEGIVNFCDYCNLDFGFHNSLVETAAADNAVDCKNPDDEGCKALEKHGNVALVVV